jgi:hypothetical protein
VEIEEIFPVHIWKPLFDKQIDELFEYRIESYAEVIEDKTGEKNNDNF